MLGQYRTSRSKRIETYLIHSSAADHTVRQYRTWHSKRVGRLLRLRSTIRKISTAHCIASKAVQHHTFCQYRTWRSKRVGGYRSVVWTASIACFIAW
eukprot:3868481-Rhodomonas_salina.2